MIKVTKTKTVTFTLPDDYKEKWLEHNYYEPEEEEYKEHIAMSDEEFFSGFYTEEICCEDGFDFISWDENETTKIEKI